VRSAEEGAQPPDVAQRLLVAGAAHQPRRLAPGVGREAHEGLAQRHAVPAGEAGEPAHAGVQQMTVGRVRHRLGLHRGADGGAPGMRLRHGADALRRGDGLGQHGFRPLRADAVAPARHRGAVEREAMPEPGLAAEGLEVGVLHPLGADLLVESPFACFSRCSPAGSRVGRPGRPVSA
jgi:hypothetical protein